MVGVMPSGVGVSVPKEMLRPGRNPVPCTVTSVVWSWMASTGSKPVMTGFTRKKG